ncbi:glutathione S-transferase [Xylaria digitata]|nr:glutathione S-transferase [Xylaria digitata]
MRILEGLGVNCITVPIQQSIEPLLTYYLPSWLPPGLTIHSVTETPDNNINVATGPNSWKVAIILKELAIPYETKLLDYSVLHDKPFTDINPNGRSLHDPNTNITLWESCAINEYLIDKHDAEHKLTHTTSPGKYLEKQYLYFQASGQGPYYGQAAWFNSFHPEPVPSAKERYGNETRRIISVLDGILADRKYLVGEKITYADLAFVTWDHFVDWCVAPNSWDINAYPNFKRWHEEMMARPSVVEALEERDAGTINAGVH